MGEEQLRTYLEGWEEIFANILFYLLAGISGLLILWLVTTLILLFWELTGIMAASVWGLFRGFVTELFYWADRVKKLLKHYVKFFNKRL